MDDVDELQNQQMGDVDQPQRQLLDLPIKIWKYIFSNVKDVDKIAMSLTCKKGLSIVMTYPIPSPRLSITVHNCLTITITTRSTVEIKMYTDEVNTWTNAASKSRSRLLMKKKRKRAAKKYIWRYGEPSFCYWFIQYVYPPATLPKPFQVEIPYRVGNNDWITLSWNMNGFGLKQLLNHLLMFCAPKTTYLELYYSHPFFTPSNIATTFSEITFQTLEVTVKSLRQEWTAKQVIKKCLPFRNLIVTNELDNGIERMNSALCHQFNCLKLDAQLFEMDVIPPFDAKNLQIETSAETSTDIFGQLVLRWFNSEISNCLHYEVIALNDEIVYKHTANLRTATNAKQVRRVFYEHSFDRNGYITRKRIARKGFDITRDDGKVATIFLKEPYLFDGLAHLELYVWNNDLSSIEVGNAVNNTVRFESVKLHILSNGVSKKHELLLNSERFSTDVVITARKDVWFQIMLQFVVEKDSMLYYEHYAEDDNNEYIFPTFVRFPIGQFSKSEVIQSYTAPFDMKINSINISDSFDYYCKIVNRYKEIIACWNWKININYVFT